MLPAPAAGEDKGLYGKNTAAFSWVLPNNNDIRRFFWGSFVRFSMLTVVRCGCIIIRNVYKQRKEVAVCRRNAQSGMPGVWRS